MSDQQIENAFINWYDQLNKASRDVKDVIPMVQENPGAVQTLLNANTKIEAVMLGCRSILVQLEEGF